MRDHRHFDGLESPFFIVPSHGRKSRHLTHNATRRRVVRMRIVPVRRKQNFRSVSSEGTNQCLLRAFVRSNLTIWLFKV